MLVAAKHRSIECCYCVSYHSVGRFIFIPYTILHYIDNNATEINSVIQSQSQSQSQRVLLQQNHKHTWNNTETETHLGLFASYNLGLSYIAMTSLWWQQG